MWPGEGKSIQNWPSFIRGDPVGSKMKAKLMTQINVNCNILHKSFGFFLFSNIFSLGEFRGWEPFFGSCVLKVPKIGGGLKC